MERVFIFHFFQWLVNGRLGANGPNVLGLVEQDFSYERGLFQQLPKMVARHVLAIIKQEDRVEKQNVLVKYTTYFELFLLELVALKYH